MNTAEIIKAVRERSGMTQEELAEKVSVSRQAVSKWEMGLSTPSPEHLRALANLLHMTFPPSREGTSSTSSPGSHWKGSSLVLGTLCILLAAALLTALLRHTAPQPQEATITGIYFFDADGRSLQPDLGDGWHAFSPGSRVWMEVTFRDSIPESSVYAVSLFLPPYRDRNL